MKLTVHQSRIKTIRTNDSGWLLKDNNVLSPRAGFEINSHCPKEYRQILAECINRGWIMPVAHVYDHELTFDTLKETTL